jgi:hypothetical protein
MVAGIYLPQILKLKVGAIELEKTSIGQITTSASLGIRRDEGIMKKHKYTSASALSIR